MGNEEMFPKCFVIGFCFTVMSEKKIPWFIISECSRYMYISDFFCAQNVFADSVCAQKFFFASEFFCERNCQRNLDVSSFSNEYIFFFFFLGLVCIFFFQRRMFWDASISFFFAKCIHERRRVYCWWGRKKSVWKEKSYHSWWFFILILQKKSRSKICFPNTTEIVVFDKQRPTFNISKKNVWVWWIGRIRTSEWRTLYYYLTLKMRTRRPPVCASDATAVEITIAMFADHVPL